MDHQYTSLQLVAAGHSDPGQRRELNEDAWRVAEIEASGDLWEERGRLFAVADGMGGHAAGEVASQLAIETLFAEYYGPGDYPLPPAMRLEQAINVANGRIYEQSATKSSQAGMGTTIVAAVVRDDWLTVANVGDSRAYLIRDGQVTQITKDHSWVAEQVEAGLLTEQEAEGHMYRSVVTRCLGHRPEAQIDTFEQPLEAGDAILLCSDGLSNQVSDLELAQILARYPPAQGVGELIELANRYGGPDNITAVLLSAREPGTAAPAAAAPVEDAAPPKPKPAPRLPDEEEPKPDTAANLRWVLPAALTLATLCVVGTGLALWGSGYVRNWLSTATPETTLAPLITATPSSTPTTSPTRTPLPTATPAPPTATPTAPPTLTPTSTPSPTPTTVPTRTPLPDTGPQLGP